MKAKDKTCVFSVGNGTKRKLPCSLILLSKNGILGKYSCQSLSVFCHTTIERVLTKKKFDDTMNGRQGLPMIAETCKDWKMSYVKFTKRSLNSLGNKDWWCSG